MKDIVIRGLPPSKSNTYKIITLKGKNGKNHSSLGKSQDAKQYEKSFWVQLPRELRNKNIESEFGLMVDVFFERANNDLDNVLKIILDCLQQDGNRVIKNDNKCHYILARKFTGYQPKIKFSLLSPRAFELLFEFLELIKSDQITEEFKNERIFEIINELKTLL